MLSEKIVAIGVAILNIIIVILVITRLQRVIEILWAHQNYDPLLTVGGLIILSIAIIGAIFNILLFGLMVWFKNYQSQKTLVMVTIGVVLMSLTVLIVLQ